jgi:hypothetical protein
VVDGRIHCHPALAEPFHVKTSHEWDQFSCYHLDTQDAWLALLTITSPRQAHM